MDKHSAEDYYTFGTSYFDYLGEQLSDQAFLLYAELEETPISGAIFFHTNGSMHYHLAGSDAAYRNLAAGNLLLYEAALWGAAHGMSRLHLGGGKVADGQRRFGIGRSGLAQPLGPVGRLKVLHRRRAQVAGIHGLAMALGILVVVVVRFGQAPG